MKPAVFLDRDGVLIEDSDLIRKVEQIHVLDRVPEALHTLKSAGFALVVVSNQAVVARGLCTEGEVVAINQQLQAMLLQAGAPQIDGWYFCPHHPNATLSDYRAVCECRKPRPGMLLQAANEHGLDLRHSFTVGDRITDIIAGAAAGTRTVLVETGRHADPPIQTVDRIDTGVRPDYICADLMTAAQWIVRPR